MNPRSILSEDKETADRNRKRNECETRETKELDVTENSRKEEEESAWCKADAIAQETLDKLMSKMHQVQSEL